MINSLIKQGSWGSLPNLLRKDIFIFSMHPINTIHILNDGSKHKEIKAKFIQRRRGNSVGILLFIELLNRFSWKTMFSLGRNKDFRAILKGAYIHLPIYLFLFGNYVWPSHHWEFLNDRLIKVAKAVLLLTCP